MKTVKGYQLSIEEMRKYTSQYVAVMEGKVIASGKDIYKKVDELERKHPEKEITIAYIPTEDLLILWL